MQSRRPRYAGAGRAEARVGAAQRMLRSSRRKASHARGRQLRGRGYAYYTSANDHRGRRMFTRTTAPSGTVTESWFVYDDEDKLIGVRHYSGGTVRDEMLFYADGEPVFRMALDNGWSEVDRSFLYADHLGTPRIGVSVEVGMGSPTVTYRAPREPFMASAPVQQNAVPVRLRFPGQWEDVDTQFTLWNGDQLSTPLLGNHARTMDPSAGAYTAVEPMWRRSVTADPFSAYALLNPTQFTDPTGNSAEAAWWLVLGANPLGTVCIPYCMRKNLHFMTTCLGRSPTWSEQLTGNFSGVRVPRTGWVPERPNEPQPRAAPRDDAEHYYRCLNVIVSPCVLKCSGIGTAAAVACAVAPSLLPLGAGLLQRQPAF